MWMGVLGLTISISLGNFMNCRENGFSFKPLTPMHPSGRRSFRGHGEGEEECRSKRAGREEGESREEEGGRKGGGRGG